MRAKKYCLFFLLHCCVISAESAKISLKSWAWYVAAPLLITAPLFQREDVCNSNINNKYVHGLVIIKVLQLALTNKLIGGNWVEACINPLCMLEGPFFLGKYLWNKYCVTSKGCL